MPDPSIPKPPRRPFQNIPPPEPFYRTSEFLRFVLLVFGLLIVGLIALFVYARTEERQAAELAQAEREAELPPLPSQADAEARDVRLKSLFEGSLADTDNGEDFRQTSGYRRLLEILMSYPADEVERRAVRKLDWKAAMADPDAWRGEFVWARGVVADAYAVKLDEPVFGRTDVYQAILTEGDGAEGVFLDTLEPLPSLELRDDPVDVYGIFYRTVRYVTFHKERLRKDAPASPYRTSTPEGDVQMAPYLLVKTVRRVAAAKRNPTGILQNRAGLALIGIALAIGAVHLLVYWFQRRSRRRAANLRADGAGFREMFEKKLKDRGRTPKVQGPRPEA